MRRNFRWSAATGLLALLALGLAPARPALQVDRPILVLMTYSASTDPVLPGKNFNLYFRLGNTGAAKAKNIIVTFTSGDFLPRRTGGVIADTAMSAGADTGYTQPMTASPDVAAGSIGTIDMSVAYTDEDGNAYSGTFTLTIRVGRPPAPNIGPTRTPTPALRPLLLVDGYDTTVHPLKPGSQFVLSLRIRNVGAAEAREVTLVLGGGTAGSPEGTPGSAGVSGAGGNFQTFAPLGSSNVQFLGDLATNALVTTSMQLIVNNSATPGAFPLALSLIYTDPGGTTFTDDLVITLLVYSPPYIEVSFYRPPDPLFAGQAGTLPIQVVNLDRKSTVLSRMTIRAEGAEVSNGQSPIGFIDAGGYFTLDATVIPMAAGPLEVAVVIDYLDDFNNPQQVVQTLPMEVMEASFPEGGEGGGGGGPEGPIVEIPPETFWDKVLRFLRGLLGLDSSAPQPLLPTEAAPGQEGPAIPVPGPKG
jgi:hypothetical protein